MEKEEMEQSGRWRNYVVDIYAITKNRVVPWYDTCTSIGAVVKMSLR